MVERASVGRSVSTVFQHRFKDVTRKVMDEIKSKKPTSKSEQAVSEPVAEHTSDEKEGQITAPQPSITPRRLPPLPIVAKLDPPQAAR
jgi:hypothetical protein